MPAFITRLNFGKWRRSTVVLMAGLVGRRFRSRHWRSQHLEVGEARVISRASLHRAKWLSEDRLRQPDACATRPVERNTGRHCKCATGGRGITDLAEFDVSRGVRSGSNLLDLVFSAQTYQRTQIGIWGNAPRSLGRPCNPKKAARRRH
jgi:hypothetical protein